MIRVPRSLKPWLDDWSGAVGRPQTARRLIVFVTAAILVIGDRTVSASLRFLSLIEPVNPSTYHRLFSHRRWPTIAVAKVIAHFVIDRFVPDGSIKVVADANLFEPPPKRTKGKNGRPAMRCHVVPIKIDEATSGPTAGSFITA